MKRFVVLDGSSLMYRAFYALPLLTDSKGEFTNAIVGFSNMLIKLLQELSPDAMIIAFDKGKKTFRNEMYAEYKGTRQKTPEELSSQIPMLHELAEALGIVLSEKAGYEADDIIGTLATQAAEQGCEAIVVTGDRDALQLIRPNLCVRLTKKGISDVASYDEEAFRQEYGMEPIRLIDLKGLMGDSSDNIPGVPGVGQKTAMKLLQSYGSVEEVLEHIDEISGKKLQENLRNYREQALLSKQLATIDCKVPELVLDLESCRILPDLGRISAFCQRYELKSIETKYRNLFGQGEETAVTGVPHEVSVSYEEIVDAERLSVFREDEALAAAVSYEPSENGCFEQMAGIAVSGLAAGTVCYAKRGTAAYEEMLSMLSDGRDVYALQAKRLWHAGWQRQEHIVAVELLGYLLDPEQPDYKLATLLAREIPSLAMPTAFSSDAEKAACEAAAMAKLGPALRRKAEDAGLWKLYETMERPLAAVLAQMESSGICLNVEQLREKAVEVASRLDSIEQDIYTLAGEKFNINSPKQLGLILFERLGLTPLKKTKTGYSTNAEVLESLRYEHPVVESILSYRALAKLKSTYLDTMGALVNPCTGRIHTTFHQTVTATGRLSSAEPNLQNIPVRTEEGRQIRALFEPGEGYDDLLSVDYSQIELRILAHMSEDENFIDAFLQEQDIHARTAAEVFGVSLADVTPELRRKAKAVNFGIVYGISDYGLSRDLHIPRKEAAKYIELYFARYPGVKKFLDDMVAKAHADGYVTTLFGRRRALPAIKSPNYNQRTLAERMAMNTPIQGTAADIIKLAMIRAERALREAGVKSRILLQVHDELVLEVVREEIPKVSALLKDAMEHVAELSVPLVVDIHSGKNWAEAK